MRRTISSIALSLSLGCAANGAPSPAPPPAINPTGAAAGSGAGAGIAQAGSSGSVALAGIAGSAGIAGPVSIPNAVGDDADGGAGLVSNPTRGPSAAGVLLDSCKKSTMQSTLLPANILFVLDRSGSMQCNPPPTTASPDCEQAPARADATLPSKWEITTQALIAAIQALPANATVGISYFSNDDQCGVNATPSVPLLTNTTAQRDAITNSLQTVVPGGGTPIVGATILAYSYLHTAALNGTIFGNQFVVLITDGAQSEMCSDAPLCTDAASCTSLLVNEEVPKAAGPGVGIRSFVVGVPGSEPARVVLSEIAQQGGTAADGCDPQMGNCHFDMTMTQDLGAALGGALAKIAGQAITCELDVPQPDAGALDMNLVNVVYTPGAGGDPLLVRQDAAKPCNSGANGWQYTDQNTKIRLCGKVCDTIKADDGAQVDVVLGCPSVLQ